jgi:flagellin-like protein
MTREELWQELTTFLLYFIFFAVFFCTFTLYRQLILDKYDLGYIHYSYSLFEAFVLAKMILLGQKLKLGERFEGRPLLIVTIYKTLIFMLFVLVMTIGEHLLIGMLKGKSMTEIYTHLIDKGLYEIFANLLVVAFVFVLFFAFVETGRVLGGQKLYDLFIHGNQKRP